LPQSRGVAGIGEVRRHGRMLRVNGRDLRAKVVAEGGNLGFTQRGRIEYALSGGHINTDALDNSGGVDCSDHEVNLKILFQHLGSPPQLYLSLYAGYSVTNKNTKS
jgi:glutamate dehydrogenase